MKAGRSRTVATRLVVTAFLSMLAIFLRGPIPIVGQAPDRLTAIRTTMRAIEAEAASAAAGDWNRWFRDLAPFREEIRTRVAAARAAGHSPLLKAPGNPPMFDEPNDLQYLWEDTDLESWTKQRTSVEGVTAAVRWLRKRNIDVIFVPVPKMTEVYPDLVAEHVPASRLVDPQVRRLLFNLLSADVEVIDLLPLFQAARRQGAEPLYFSDDSHWAPRAQMIAVQAIAERLKRYPFVAAALSQPALFHENRTATPLIGGAWRTLVPIEDMATVRDYAWPGVQILNRQDQPVAPADASPVMLIGDSFATVSLNPGMSVDALLARELNLPISRRTASGGTVDAIKDFAREPELLTDRKVVVWVTYNGSVCSATARWSLPNLP